MDPSDVRKLAISEAIARVAEKDFEDLLKGVTENMPRCWATAFSGAAIPMATAYVAQLERVVDHGAPGQDRHRSDCDGRCSVDPCPSCARIDH